MLVAIGEVDHEHGSPLSPALRVIVAEALVRRLKKDGHVAKRVIKAEVERVTGVAVSTAYASDVSRRISRIAKARKSIRR